MGGVFLAPRPEQNSGAAEKHHKIQQTITTYEAYTYIRRPYPRGLSSVYMIAKNEQTSLQPPPLYSLSILQLPSEHPLATLCSPTTAPSGQCPGRTYYIQPQARLLTCTRTYNIVLPSRAHQSNTAHGRPSRKVSVHSNTPSRHRIPNAQHIISSQPHPLRAPRHFLGFGSPSCRTHTGQSNTR